jgi:uncharacterized protein YjgD (DUF1641 family)
MAHPIPFEPSPRDPRAELRARLDAAPAEHAEALLSAYEVLQGLHDRGLLDLARGALGAGDQVVAALVEAGRSPASIRGLRNLLLVANMLGSLEPELVRTFTEAVPLAMRQVVQERRQPGLWRLVRDFFWNPDFRRGLAALNTLFESFGRSLGGARREA